MKVVGIIPARYRSSRFPGKPLHPILEKPLVIWVCERAEQALGKENVYVATDDERIKKVVEENGYNVVMTSSDHLTGTDRLAEVATKLEADVYVNIQGDEPMIDPDNILEVVELKKKYPQKIINCMATLLHTEDPTSPNIPKVVCDQNNHLLYMSRSAVPGNKKGEYDPVDFLKQICIYGFSKEELLLFRDHPQKTPLELHEDIEILRFLELGRSILMHKVAAGSLAVDVPEDVKRVEDALSN
ncbi:MAG: 3-deoxy-manno-octulosonate cytidylyltransferase [Crocinitomicaceae bacterium]